MMTSDSDINGFTLLEILVAMVIFSVTMMTLFSSVKTFLHSADQVKSELSVDGRFSTGLQIMAADLEQIFILQPPRYRKPGFNDDPDLYRFSGTDELVDGTLFSRLVFASTHHLNLGQDTRHGVARITYYVHPQGNSFNLHRSDLLFPYDTEVNPCTDPILARDIHSFTLTFIAHQGDEHDFWDSDAESFEFALPARVTIALQMAPEPSGRQIDTGMTLPVSRRVFQ